MTCREPKEAQYAQTVLLDPFHRIADETNAPGNAIIEAVQGIEQIAIHGGVERIEREVAPLGIAGPVLAEADERAASVGIDVLAQCGDLGDELPEPQGHRAVLDAGGMDAGAR